ncbi:MAG: methyltransferase [Thaumarchaeota archaeon]|nr:MAG: methyltransferase [Nitrososphaerota archaeon]
MNFFEKIMMRILKAEAHFLSSTEYDLHHLLLKDAAHETIDYIKNKMPNAMSFPSGGEHLLDYAISEIEIDGDIMEFGVLTGRTINHIARKLKSKKIYGFDSFEGLPDDWSGHYIPKFGLSQGGNMPKVEKNVHLYKGWFSDTILQYQKENTNDISFLHVDCDIYSSTKDIFDLLGPKIKSGTIIVFDEYFNYRNWQQHEFKAFQEFVEQTKIEYEYLAFNATCACCVRIK